jgi:3-dehydroquinate dehydratase/shikimate dehydrogenase
VAIAMGSMGQVTRVCPWLFGSCWTYGGSAAPGQIPAADLISTYRVPAGSMETTIYAVAGSPIAHSASPAMHNAALAACGIDATYLALETTDADELLIVARALGVAGLSVTAPLKTGVFARASRTDELSQRVGASNTLRFDHGDWEARNFDVAGFLAPLLRREVPLADARAVVLGAGGAARTAVWALLAEGARVEVAARRIDRAAALAEEFGVAAVNWPPRPGWDLLVNTTPVGTWPAVEESPIDRADVQGDCVYDLIYNPEETALLTWAKEGGARTIGGLEMLVAQAARQFTWWTGREAPLTTIEAAVRRFVAHVTGRSS